MQIQPLLDAPLAVQIHVATVVPAAFVGAAMLLARKGTPLHKATGRVWVALMVATALSSFFIHELRVIGDFSPVHLLSLVTLNSCAVIVWSARTGRFDVHRKTVLSLYWGGVGLAGAFTLMPGRVMNEVVLGEGGMVWLAQGTPFWAWLSAAALAVAAAGALALRSASR